MNRSRKMNMSQDGNNLNEQVSSKQSKGREHDIFSDTVNDMTTYPQQVDYFSFFFFLSTKQKYSQFTTLKHTIINIKLCAKT